MHTHMHTHTLTQNIYTYRHAHTPHSHTHIYTHAEHTHTPLHHHNIVYPATCAEMQIRTSSTIGYWFFSQDADIDFKEGVESIELKVPLEDSEPVKT